MSLKQIISKPIPENEKAKKKIINTTEATHVKISLLSNLFNVSKTQVINNIVQYFMQDNIEEIKERLEIKRNELDSLF